MIATITPECINEIMSCEMSVTPTVGMLGTMYVGTDRYAVMCTKVSSPKRVKVVTLYNFESIPADCFEKKDGIEYMKKEYFDNNFSNDDGLPYSFRKNGRWMPMGLSAWGTCSIHFGVADPYQDPCF